MHYTVRTVAPANRLERDDEDTAGEHSDEEPATKRKSPSGTWLVADRRPVVNRGEPVKPTANQEVVKQRVHKNKIEYLCDERPAGAKYKEFLDCVSDRTTEAYANIGRVRGDSRSPRV